jgi:hypothetical protein
MATTLEPARTVACPGVDDRCADALRALAEATVHGPAGAWLVARLNPVYPPEATSRTLDELGHAGLVERCAHPLSSLLAVYALTGAGRRWVRERG